MTPLFDHFIRHAGGYGITVLAAYLVIGLWPFNFVTANRASIGPAGGLVLARPGTVYEAQRAEKLHGLTQFSISLDVATASDGLSSFEKIFSLARSQTEMNFIVGQWKDGVVLHIPDPARQAEIHFGEHGVFRIGERTALTIVYDGMQLLLYRDGKRIKARRTGPLSLDRWSREYPIVIGTDAFGRSQWKGTVYEITLWDRALAPGEIHALVVNRQTADSKRRNGKSLHNAGGGSDGGNGRGPLVRYVFRPEFTHGTQHNGRKALAVREMGRGAPADLVIPEQFIPCERAVLTWETDWMDNKTNWQDAAVNLLGFIPFGALLVLQAARGTTAGRRQQTAGSAKICGMVIVAVAAGFAVSLSIEWLQAYLPTRDSSMRDLAMNTAGTLLGALAAAWMMRQRMQGRPERTESEF